MSGVVLQLVPPADEGPVDPTLIPALEVLIEQIRSGEARAVAYAVVLRDGAVTTAMSPPYQHAFTMLGALERLKLRFHALHIMEPFE